MKTKFTILILICVGLESPARIGRQWSYDELKDKAALIVIATPTTVRVTNERVAAFPSFGNIRNGKEEPLMGKELETNFEILTILKGEPGPKSLVLHHFALAEPKGGTVYTANGPRLISFDPRHKRQYLMFLQREADGRYVAVSGQTDPMDSINLLRTLDDASKEFIRKVQ